MGTRLNDFLIENLIKSGYFKSEIFITHIGERMRTPKLLDKVRNEMRVKHYSRKTETAYLSWIRRFILFHNKRHPNEMSAEEIKAFIQDVRYKRMKLFFVISLSHVLNNLATKHHVSIQPVRYE